MKAVLFCKLCKKNADLVNSHAIPNSYFKKLFQKGSGKAIKLTTRDDDICYSNNSLSSLQLCRNCETHINNNYEKYTINILRDKSIQQATQDGIKLKNIEPKRIKMFYIAIYWRALNSNCKEYSGAVLPYNYLQSKINDYIADKILNNSDIPENILNVKIEHLKYKPNDPISEKLNEIIITPFHRKNSNGKSIEVCMVIEGILTTIILPGLPVAKRPAQLLSNNASGDIFIPYKDIRQDDSIMEIIDLNLKKYKSGKSKISQK